MIYSDRQCNYPHRIYGTWWLTQFRGGAWSRRRPTTRR
jgi:hypothetical protein